jgi:PBSX family phage terminase large subunit
MPPINWSLFSPKALDAMTNSTAFINLYEGAVRSSKTVIANIVFIEHMESSPHQEFLISGKDSDAIFRNVIAGKTGLLNILGSRRARYLAGAKGGAQLRVKFPGQAEKVCYCLGAHNAESEGRVQGFTSGGWLADEATLYPEGFIKQAINRHSLAGARMFWTMNPASPFHSVYTEFVQQADAKGYRHWHFELDDNYSLSEEYKASVRAAYSGLYYKRFILGLWVAAEGAIYDMLDESTHVVDTLPAMTRYWVGVDYGTASVTTFWLLGLGADQRLYFVDFWRWDAAEKQRQLSDVEFAEALETWLAELSVIPQHIFVPDDAASFVVQLQQRRRSGATHLGGLAIADRSPGSVLRRLRNVSSLFHTRRLLFSRTVQRKGGLKEWAGYVWDPKRQKAGEDAPLKQNDHDPDAGGYVVAGIENIWRGWIREAA